jgi:hypothetical protein
MIEFHAVSIRVPEIEGFAHTMIGRAIEGNAGGEETAQSIGEGQAVRIEDGGVIESGRAFRRGFASHTFPGIQAEVVVVTSGGKKSGLGTEALGHLEAEDIPPEDQGTLQIRDLEMDMTNPDAGSNGRVHNNSKAETGTEGRRGNKARKLTKAIPTGCPYAEGGQALL